MREIWATKRNGKPRVTLGQPCQSFSLVERGGVRGPARVAKIGGDGGDWSVVRSRKRKASQPKAGRRDRSRDSDGFDNAVMGWRFGILRFLLLFFFGLQRDCQQRLLLWATQANAQQLQRHVWTQKVRHMNAFFINKATITQ